MANSTHLAKLRKSIQEWNAWREANPEIVADLSETDLTQVNLSGAYLSGAYLKSWTQAALAEASGLSDREIRRIEGGKVNPSAGTVLFLAGAFDINWRLRP